MKKYDKVIAIAGVFILILAGLGIYYWVEEEPIASAAAIEDLYTISSEYSMIPDAIAISDECPFYAIVATPLAINYDEECMQHVTPLYVMDPEEVSEAVTRVEQQLGYFTIDEISDLSEKNFSLYFAEKYWKKSDGVLLVENSQSGYNLAVVATPIASYFGIPVIATNELDQDVTNVLNKLGVKYSIICGENIEGYGSYVRFDNVDDIVDFVVDLIKEKFEYINYIALANPIDAYKPKVLDSKDIYFDKSSDWSFTIPDGYKYALVTIEAEEENELSFKIGVDLKGVSSDLRKKELCDGGSAIPVRDNKGDIIKYRFYREGLVYDREEVSYSISGKTQYPAHVTIEKLENPYFEVMKGFSSLAPYLAAYHKGLVFGKPDFAFAANDDIRDNSGNTIPGFYMSRYNSELIPFSNRHIYDNIHRPLNNLLAKIAGIEIKDRTYIRDIEFLHDYYSKKDLSIALVGGTVGLPQYVYQNILEPFGDINNDGVDDSYYRGGGGGTASDVIYGNIDPVKYDWSPLAEDIYTDLPQMENAVGRIIGWDVQDECALILRSIFYNEIVENLEEWRNNVAVLIGDGVDHQKPWLPFTLEKYLGLLSMLKKVLASTPFAGLVTHMDPNGPWKQETGATEIGGLRAKYFAEKMGYDVNFALKSHAMIWGYSDEELEKILNNKIKKENILKRLLYRNSIDDFRELIGESVVKGGEYMENSNIILANAHGAITNFGMDGPDLVSTGLDLEIIPGEWITKLIRRITPLTGGWQGPGEGLGIPYKALTVTELDLGPSFMFLDSCTCGKIDGVHPYQSVSTAFLHAGLGTLIASTTGSNIPGGYLPGKDKMTDNPISIWKARKEWEQKAENGKFPDPHFGFKLYEDLTVYMNENNASVGESLRIARNKYLPEDIGWKLWWTPPLSSGTAVDVYGKHEEEKHTTYFEFNLYGDPAFNPYEPENEGKQ